MQYERNRIVQILNEMNHGRCNEWDGLWTEGNEMKHKEWGR